MKRNTPGPQLRQVQDGVYIGCQGTSTAPVFWIWRPIGQSTEYWVFYKLDQPGGFQRPSSANPSVDWNIKYATGGDYRTGCEFLSWIAAEHGMAESDLEAHEHSIQVLSC